MRRRLRGLSLVALLVLVLLGVYRDTTGGHWSPEGAGQTDPQHVSTGSPAAPGWLPEIPARRALRFCCALGYKMRASFGPVPLPFLETGAVLDTDQMRQHHYDGGGAPAELLSVIDEKLNYSIPDVEQNGLIYTCDGGLVDTSHIRELVDWTAFLYAQFDRILETGGRVRLPDEGATRTVIVKGVPSELIAQLGRDRLILTMAQWTAYQTSIWHETAQWYGFSIWSLFPETASGFSPEDPFANAMGVNLLGKVDARKALESADSFNRTVSSLMVDAVERLRPLPRSVTVEVLEAVDGIWWDSEVRLPGKATVMRREFDIVDGELRPWLLPRSIASAQLQSTLDKACGADPEPAIISIPDSVDGVAVSDFVSLEIVLDDSLRELPAFAGIERFNQRYFPEMVEKVKAENLIEFGEGSDRPD